MVYSLTVEEITEWLTLNTVAYSHNPLSVAEKTVIRDTLMAIKTIAESSNGRKADFESVNDGSSPSSASNELNKYIWKLRELLMEISCDAGSYAEGCTDPEFSNFLKLEARIRSIASSSAWQDKFIKLCLHYDKLLESESEKADLVQFWKSEYKSLAEAGVERLADYGIEVDPAIKIIENANYREGKFLEHRKYGKIK